MQDMPVIGWSVLGGTLPVLVLVVVQLWRIRVPLSRIVPIVLVAGGPFFAAGIAGSISFVAENRELPVLTGWKVLVAVLFIERLGALLGAAFPLAICGRYRRRYDYFHGEFAHGQGAMWTLGLSLSALWAALMIVLVMV